MHVFESCIDSGVIDIADPVEMEQQGAKVTKFGRIRSVVSIKLLFHLWGYECGQLGSDIR